jgi:hypothetical protein
MRYQAKSACRVASGRRFLSLLSCDCTFLWRVAFESAARCGRTAQTPYSAGHAYCIAHAEPVHKTDGYQAFLLYALHQPLPFTCLPANIGQGA